jgi:hypothetical protein
MTFDEILSQVQDLRQREQRVSYRGLKRRFALDDEYIEDLKEELIGAKRIAVDEDGRFTVWIRNQNKGETAKRGKGEQDGPESKAQNQKAQAPDPSPVSYTPAHLAERIRAEQAAMEARGNVDGERKTITALFADIKGSTDLIADLDPEEARAILDPTLQLMMDAVHRYEGYVAQALGDGIFALFGAPIAHEHHPQRALLGREQAEEMLDALLANTVETLPATSLPDLKRFVLNKTEGHPFFMEEIVQELHEQGILTDPRRVSTAY